MGAGLRAKTVSSVARRMALYPGDRGRRCFQPCRLIPRGGGIGDRPGQARQPDGDRGQHRQAGDQLTIDVGGGSGNAKVLLIGFDHDHETAIRRGENGGRTLEEANVVRSIRAVGDWQGNPLRVSEKFPDGQDVAVILQAPDGRIVGAARL